MQNVMRSIFVVSYVYPFQLIIPYVEEDHYLGTFKHIMFTPTECLRKVRRI